MVKAVHDKIVVEILKRTKSEGGIILPENSIDPQSYGKVLSVGEEVPSTIEEDSILVFHNRAGMDMLVGKKILKCLKYEEVYGELTDEEVKNALVELEISGMTEGEQQVKEKSSLIHPVS